MSETTGTWQLCDPPHGDRCAECGAWVARVWRYWVGVTSIRSVCEECAEKA